MFNRLIWLIIILLTITSCNTNPYKMDNIQDNNFNNSKIYFLDSKWEEYSIEYDKLNIDNIPKNISLIHFWHKLEPLQVESIFWYNLNFIENPEIVISYESINENIHKIFTNLDITIFNWLIHVYNNCEKWIEVWKDISDMYFKSNIDEFSIYTVCSSNVSIPVSCKFEWEEKNQGKVTCG
jgi:hypothetical protein